MIQYTLREKDMQKASIVIGIDEATLRRLNDQGLINTNIIRKMLIKYDYERLVAGLKILREDNKAYTYKELLFALQKEYDLGPTQLLRILRKKGGYKECYCKICGKRVPPSTYKRTRGFCSECYSEELLKSDLLNL